MNEFFDKQQKEIFLFMIICVLIIMIYGHLRCQLFPDPLQKKLPIWDLDGWSVIHFLFYMSMSFMYPKYFWTITICGILWELFEEYCNVYQPTIFKKYGPCASTDVALQKGNERIWWYGKISDIVMNVLGSILGYSFYNKFQQNIFS
jgi:hypothetical protein